LAIGCWGRVVAMRVIPNKFGRSASDRRPSIQVELRQPRRLLVDRRPWLDLLGPGRGRVRTLKDVPFENGTWLRGATGPTGTSSVFAALTTTRAQPRGSRLRARGSLHHLRGPRLGRPQPGRRRLVHQRGSLVLGPTRYVPGEGRPGGRPPSNGVGAGARPGPPPRRAARVRARPRTGSPAGAPSTIVRLTGAPWKIGWDACLGAFALVNDRLLPFAPRPSTPYREELAGKRLGPSPSWEEAAIEPINRGVPGRHWWAWQLDHGRRTGKLRRPR